MVSTGAATAANVVIEGGFGDEPIPKPTGKLYDQSGHTLAPTRTGLMNKIDDKGSKEVTFRQSTVWIFSTVPALLVALLMLLFSYGSSLMGWTRDDQAVRSDVQGVKEAVKELKEQVTALQKTMTDQQIQEAKIQGFKAGVAEAQTKEK